MIKKIAVLSLGCDKNRVDTETMLSHLKNGGHSFTNNFQEAEIIIINTCAFIESARAEAIDNILQMAEFKKANCEKLIVTGCLPQKYSEELTMELKEVDAFLGVANYQNICSVIDKLYLNQQICDTAICDIFNKTDRILTTPMHYAYLKIADGCNNFCTFCTIPSIRGKYKSRAIESLVDEASMLINNGVKEIILVAQDVTRYGEDIYGENKLIALITEITKLNIVWLRLMYCYPELVTDKLIENISHNDKVAKYIDIPLQHVDDGILKLMNRKSDNSSIVKLIEQIRSIDSSISIRTTFMVGFPSESQEQFENLCNFSKKYKLDNVGIFAYSLEEDTPSAKIKGHLTTDVKQARVNKLGRIHKLNAIEKNKSFVGKILKVLYEDIDYERNMFVGRTQFNAPDIDSVVYFKADFVDVGEFYDIKITAYDEYDLIGEKV